MEPNLGDPIKGSVHSTDASAGVEIPIYDAGSVTARTLAANEYIVIHSISLVTVPGGDAYVILGPDASIGTGETVIRGTFAANGGIEAKVNAVGVKAAKAFVTAPIGAVDVNFYGVVRKDGSLSGITRAPFESALIPGRGVT